MARRTLLAASFAAGFLVHAAAALALWWGGVAGLREIGLAWIDFPLSLAWAAAPARAVLAWSLTAGGLWWGALTSLLTHLVGRSVRRRRAGGAP